MRVHLKGIHSATKRLADGTKRTYYYAWKRGPRLDGEPDSQEFLLSYQRAWNSRDTKAEGTMFQLLSEYRNSPEFTSLRDRTRRDYARYLRMIENEFATLPITAIDEKGARKLFKDWRAEMAGSPRKADLAWSVLARVLSVAQDNERIMRNPCERGGRLYRSERADRTWNEGQIGTAYAGFPAPLRWALMLALWTGQRQGDLLRLSWSGYDGTHIELVQSKTGAPVRIRCGQPLQAEIATIPRRSTMLLTNSRGRPWTSDGFRASWAKACRRCGIDGVTFHDLRGSAITRLAEAGCSNLEIAAISGHSDKSVDQILRVYLNRRNGLAETAITKLEGMRK